MGNHLTYVTPDNPSRPPLINFLSYAPANPLTKMASPGERFGDLGEPSENKLNKFSPSVCFARGSKKIEIEKVNL